MRNELRALSSVADDPGSKPDQRCAWQGDRQLKFGKLSINSGLQGKRFRSWFSMLVECEGPDSEIVIR